MHISAKRMNLAALDRNARIEMREWVGSLDCGKAARVTIKESFWTRVWNWLTA